MKNIPAALIIAFLLNACVSAQVVPTEHQVRSIERVRIVALVPPPLDVASPLVLHSMQLSQFPMVSTGPTSVLLVISGILMSAELNSTEAGAAQRSWQNLEGLEGILGRKDLWKPTDILAEELELQLSAGGWQTARSMVLQAIPGVDDLSYAYMWEPLRHWYNDDVSPFDYSTHLIFSNETVVEVGIIEYTVFPEGRLLLKLGVKVVDPITMKILGRTYELEYAPLDIDEAFQEDGKIFKEVVSQTGKELIKRCLVNLHLVPHP
jgi:hypothetical protein